MHFSDFIAQLHALIPWLPIWSLAVLIVAAVLLGVLGAQDLGMRLLSHHVAQSNIILRRLFHRTRRVVRFGMVILGVSLLTPFLPVSASIQSAIQSALAAALIILAGWIVLVAANTAADGYLNRLKIDVADNLLARKAVTQVRVLKRTLNTIIVILTAGFALMTFQSVRQFGISIFASAGVAGIVLGLAARPVLGNLIAGIQIAITQPIRIDDAVVIENEWGWVEEINATYVVVRLWDRRRLIVPLSRFLENSFQNWTRNNASIIGSIMLYLDYTAPVDKIREKLMDIVRQEKFWDSDVVNLQVTDAKDETIELRILVSAANSSEAWDLRCEVREKMLAYIQAEHPSALPRRRNITHTISNDADIRRSFVR